ncbi:baseplate assembly protein [Salinivibrio proteolyticus]|nr:baseplate assembly protein [Salinivibrio proteolyticus]
MLSLLNRIESLERELKLMRQQAERDRLATANIIRLGYVVVADKNTVSVKTGDNLATRIPFFVFCAGRVSHYRRPTLGEQCLLLNLGSGDNLNNAVALMGLPSDKFPSPTVKENEFMTDYSGGMKEVYNLDTGKLTCHYPGGVEMYAPKFKNHGEIIDHTRSMEADRNIYDSHDHPESIGSKTSPPTQKQSEK